MNLFTYRLLTSLALPLIAYSGWKRCKKHRKQLQENSDLVEIDYCFRSRFGFNPTPFQTGGVWVHAVSVGETRSIFPLLSAIKQYKPGLPITVTNGSTQGAIQSLKFSPVPIQHQMIPYDYTFAVNRFLDQIQPKLVVMVETEIWPNLYQACINRNIPIVLINARLKESSFKAYKKWGGKLISKALNQTKFIAAQFQADADHFQALGTQPENIEVLGNLKFDLELDPSLTTKAQAWIKENNLQNRPIWVAASTHAHPETPDISQSEEHQIIEAHKQLLKKQPNALLILVPRHADRFIEVAEIIEKSGLNWQRRTEQKTINADTQIYLADTVGELMLWFEASSAAFIGGSLVPFGGHNILEPAALKKPVISGPHFQNLKALFEPFIGQQAIELVNNPTELSETLQQLIEQPDMASELATKAYDCFIEQTGALDKTMTLLKPYLDS